jgi:hypothetical protein
MIQMINTSSKSVEDMLKIFNHKKKFKSVTPRIFWSWIFFFSSLSKFGCYLSFPFLFAKTSPVFKTLSYVIIVNPRVNFLDLLHHAEPCTFLVV